MRGFVSGRASAVMDKLPSRIFWSHQVINDSYKVRCSAVYLAAADKYRRLTHRLSQEQKGLDERALMVSQRLSAPDDTLEAGRAHARCLLRRSPFAVPTNHSVHTDS